ncbi:hypothetical protein GWO43_08045, partial [candidate division KSB1 bacterium]|nr:hypothetical protein [candidate division KSB1 bacterium]NIR70023.1 hypothetical protein [candidate division KSB1 bacterium]NIS23921.1 hypothetical protein [candidate division KSB1 bacterium]NIT70838.1 hypothetical protein [candidate division KSB1 bacterium]NIU24569.1 hypothetical protein [candidate division KSB1 bacterium]
DVRMLRAMNSLHLPDFFHRLQYSLKDFMFITKAEEFKHWAVENQADVYYYFGVALKKDGKPVKAQKYFGLAAKTAPESNWAKKANEELQKFRQAN